MEEILECTNFKRNIKRSIIIKEMIKYDILEYKIIRDKNNFQIYITKNGSYKDNNLLYEFKKYNNNDKVLKRKTDDTIKDSNNELINKFKKIKVI